MKETTCPHCLRTYLMGYNGTINGCDECEGIVRNPDGTINYYESTRGETHITRQS